MKVSQEIPKLVRLRSTDRKRFMTDFAFYVWGFLILPGWYKSLISLHVQSSLFVCSVASLFFVSTFCFYIFCLHSFWSIFYMLLNFIFVCICLKPISNLLLMHLSMNARNWSVSLGLAIIIILFTEDNAAFDGPDSALLRFVSRKFLI